MATWDDFFPHILPQVRGCDDDVVRFHARQAAIEFCRRSQCWKQELPITTASDVTAYAIPFPDGAVGSLLVSITVTDTDGIPNDDYDVVSTPMGRDLERNYVDGCFAYLSDDGLTLHVAPAPDADGAQLLPYLSLKPSQDSTGVPDWLFEQHADSIAAGALQRLLALPRTEWRDPAAAAAQGGKFLGDAGAASAKASRSSSRARTRVRGFLY